MKAWHVSELNNVVRTLEPLLGSRLQEIQTTDGDLVLGFYTNLGLLWLWIDLNPTQPSVLPWGELPIRPKWKKSPLNLFLRAHFQDRVLTEVRMAVGRVVQLQFGTAETGGHILEIQVIPHIRNVLARAAGKQVAWQKPTLVDDVKDVDFAPLKVRSLEELRDQWLNLRGSKTGGRSQGAVDARSRLEQELKRKKKALVKVEEELARKQEQPWRNVGDWLKINQSMDVPKEWEPFVDKRRKLAWNIEECFARAREVEGKIFGTEKRRELLLKDISTLQQTLDQPASQLPAAPINYSPPAPPVALKELQGRTLKLSGEITVIAGKSAADNMKLLRRARAWDLWIHLRDFPSSHAILFRNKNTKVTDSTLYEATAWFVRMFLGKKIAQHAGEKFQVLVAECRHVRPIKGDKLGRVTYHDERTLIYQIPTN